MLFKITFNPVIVLTLLKTLLIHIGSEYQNVPLEQLYLKNGLTLQYHVLTSALPTDSTYDEAVVVCQSKTTDMYTVSRFHDLDKIMDHFNTTEVWINVSKNQKLNTLIDIQGHYPVTATDTQTVFQTNIRLETMLLPEDKIVLTRSADHKFSYEHKKGVVGQTATGICIEVVSFPFEEDDLADLKNIAKVLEEQAKGLLKHVDKDIRISKGQITLLPLVKPNQTISTDENVDLTKQFTDTISIERRRFDDIMSRFRLLKDDAQLTTLVTAGMTQIVRLSDIAKSVQDILNNPVEMITTIYDTVYLWEENKKYPRNLYRLDDDNLILKVGNDNLKVTNEWKKFFNTSDFWKMTFIDILIVVAGILSSVAVLTATIYKYCITRKNRRRTRRPFVVKQGQLARTNTEMKVITERKIPPPFTGACRSAKRRHSLILPTTLVNQDRARAKRARSIKRKQPLYQLDSDLSD
jgi:hypothetical protein